MLRGLGKLTWVELKIFVREPLGSVSTLIVPVVLFVTIGSLIGGAGSESFDAHAYIGGTLPVFVVMVIMLNNVTSLTTILSIYRENGILKRLKATPLSPVTILTAHVLVKLVITAINLAMLLLVGKTFFNVELAGNAWAFGLAVTISAISILSLGFVIASLAPTARFGPTIAMLLLYPLLAISGLFVSVDLLPLPLRLAAFLSPITHAVTLMHSTWVGLSWHSLGIEVAMLTLAFVASIFVSTKVFRWE